MFEKVREKLAKASSLLTRSSTRGSKFSSLSKGHAVSCPAKEKAPGRPASSCCEGQPLPRLMIPENVKVRDDIDRAMATNPDCDPDDSPTWGKQSAFSVSLSWDGANGVKEVEDLINGTTWSATGSRLGKSPRPCVWTEGMVERFEAAYVVYEARRRVRRWYNDKYVRLQDEVDRELAEHLARHPDRLVS